MKESAANFARALAVLLMFVPAPLAMVGTPEAYADDGSHVVAAEPAVVIPEAEEAEEEDPWTARFLAPAVVVIGVITVAASTSYYLVRVRGRYRVVQ